MFTKAKAMFTKVRDAVKPKVEVVVEATKKASIWIYEAMKNLAKKVWNGIRYAVAYVAATVVFLLVGTYEALLFCVFSTVEFIWKGYTRMPSLWGVFVGAFFTALGIQLIFPAVTVWLNTSILHFLAGVLVWVVATRPGLQEVIHFFDVYAYRPVANVAFKTVDWARDSVTSKEKAVLEGELIPAKA